MESTLKSENYLRNFGMKKPYRNENVFLENSVVSNLLQKSEAETTKLRFRIRRHYKEPYMSDKLSKIVCSFYYF